MKTCLGVIWVLWLAAGWAHQAAADEESRTRFCAVDIYLDSQAAPLAAYQLEFSATNGVARIVGIEGGDHAAYRNPPFYDPLAMQHERVILAAFSVNDASELPRGRTRVATVHLQIQGGATPVFLVNLKTAADTQGGRISARIDFAERENK